MASTYERKACNSCAKAKQKCSKQDPRCIRCAERGIKCIYPRSKQSYQALSRVQAGSASAPPGSSCTGTGENLHWATSITGVPGAVQESNPGSNLLNDATTPEQLVDVSSIWFLGPETWEIRNSPHIENQHFSSAVLKRNIAELKSWLSQWVTKGCNPFIHSRLYSCHIPRCIQDAYSAIVMYNHRTPCSEETVFRIISERVTQLVDDQQHAELLNTFDRLAIVQAMIVYQAIRLYDGDIRMRHDAEEDLVLLDAWALAMMESAAACAGAGEFLALANWDKLTPAQSRLETPTQSADEVLWNAWVVAESVRRTWAVAASLHTVYKTMQRGWAACPGGVMFTTRKGVWEAESALSWGRLCSKVYVGFMHQQGLEELLDNADPADVDDFSRATLEMSFGMERLELWEVEAARKGCANRCPHMLQVERR